MTRLIIQASRCKSCGYCVDACPKQALTLSGSINKKGYQSVQLDNDLCIQCGICYNVCPDCVFELVDTEAE